MRSADLIRPIEALTRTRVIAFEFVIQLPRLTVLQIENSVDRPTTCQSLVVTHEGGKCITEVPGEASPDIEARVPAIPGRDRTVLRLRLVRQEFFEITCCVNRVRPNEVRLRRQSMPSAHLQACLKRVIDRVGR